jgi:hypothetical protein
MENFITFISSLPSPISIIVLLLISLIAILSNVDKLKNLLPKTKKQKRSCSDCILLLFHKKEDYMRKRHVIESHIIPDQIQFSRQKINDIEFQLLKSYRENLTILRKEVDYIRENKEYILFRECLKNALHLVDRECERIFNENGFYKLGDAEFQSYVKNTSKNLVNIASEYMLAAYPSSDMIISIEFILENLDVDYISNIALDIFIRAREIKSQSDQSIIAIDKEFKFDIDQFISGLC